MSPEAGESKLSVSQRTLRCLALALLVIYIGWQVVWLAHGQLPPALFLALTGWPAPTTGGTRSIMAMLSCDWRLAMAYNVMSVPILVTSVVTFAWMCRHARDLSHKGLPRSIVITWVAVLLIAWLIKFAQALNDTFG